MIEQELHEDDVVIVDEDEEGDLSEPSDETRLTSRLDSQDMGIIRFKRTRIFVTVQDLSFQGFGILSPQVLPMGREVELEISAPSQVEFYSCRVAFCSREDIEGKESYRVGLEILDQEEEIMQIVDGNDPETTLSP
ncbi:MAG: PilZ domain-containing protein [Magnetococcales bacterium]|nr:PilZ domain-containing protein [Magnetococcales bacterium]